jgi:beta-phosphoglucomutase
MVYKAALFDLDGVLVDTARYHYLAWKNLADGLGFEFTLAHNERLKGVSRMASLDILLEVGGLDHRFTPQEKDRMAAEKNQRYLGLVAKMEPSEILEGVVPFLSALKDRKVKIALGSASKNAPLILERVGLTRWFDALVDGTDVTKAKPDPEVFLLGARRLDVLPGECVVFEDAQAGLEAARAGGMHAVGLGRPEDLPGAHEVFRGLFDVDPARYFG